MRMLTKILPLFLCAGPMTVLAMDGKNIDPSKDNKRPYSLIKAEEEKSQEHKRQRIQEQEIIAELDHKEPDEKYRDKYKGSEKYKRIDNFENYLESLKKLAPEFRNLALGDDPERRLGIMEDVLEQLKKRYYRDFFARRNSPDFDPKKDLSNEIIQKIFYYCSMKDFASLLLASHDARDAVYSLMPVFQEVVRYGKYQDINEFLNEFHQKNSRAYAAAGIAQYHSPKGELHRRNKWLDFAYKACDLSAVSFVFQEGLFENHDGSRDGVYKNLEIIQHVYKEQGVGKDLSLDKGVASYLEDQIKNRRSKKEINSVINILRENLPRSIEANLILFSAYQNGIITKQKKKLVAIPEDINKASYYRNKANEIADSLPNFERGLAHYEIGFWCLVKNSTYGEIIAEDLMLGMIDYHWKQALDAWTEAEEGNRQKAVTQFKKVIMESSLFSRKARLPKYPSSTPTFLSTTEHSVGRASENQKFVFKFLEKVYEKDKEADDQLKPYHEDINMWLILARHYYVCVYSIINPSVDYFNNASFYFKAAIEARLNDYDEEIKDKFRYKTDAISQGQLNYVEKLGAYVDILKQLGLDDPNLTANPSWKAQLLNFWH